ncbi:MAG TPA: (d)CMP kinase [Candidatus Anoxymicrobiaceae bacterium]|jgi:CMP/dCMP kinase
MSDEPVLVIAIDGPAASGKSTVAIMLARRLGLALVDSGSMYRAATLLAIERGVSLDDDASLAEIARELRESFDLELPPDSPARVSVHGRDISSAIRSPEIGEAVSPVSAVKGVREEMVKLQRSLVRKPGAVVEGRDIGTTVFPEAPLKVYLEASQSERTRRRYAELTEKGLDTTESSVRQEIAMRDEIDSSRESSPLAAARDALRVDTTELTIEDVVQEITSELERRGLCMDV